MCSEELARVLSRQRRSILREVTTQYKMREKLASTKLARVLSRQRRSIRRKTTAQYKMTAKPPYKKLARVPSRQRRSIRREMTAQYKISKKVASENWREFRPRKHRFCFLQRRYSTQGPEEMWETWRNFPTGKKWRQVEEDECKTCLAKMGESSVTAPHAVRTSTPIPIYRKIPGNQRKGVGGMAKPLNNL